MATSQAALRYAKALLEVAQKQGELDVTIQELAAIRESVARSPEIRHLLMNATISQEEKEDFIGKIFAECSHQTVLSFIKVLVRKKRFTELNNIEEEFQKLAKKAKGVMEVTVISSTPLSQANTDKLIKKLEDLLKHKIELISEIDPTLIGGAIIQFDGYEINGSYKLKLEQIKQQLLETA